MVSRSVESAQKRVEGNNFDARKRLLQYDDVLRQQREVIYKERNEVLSSDNIRHVLEGMLTSVIDRTVDLYTDENGNINAKGLKDFVDANLLPEDRLSVSDLEGKTADELKEFLGQAAFARYD